WWAGDSCDYLPHIDQRASRLVLRDEPRSVLDDVLDDVVVALEDRAHQRRETFGRLGVHVEPELLDEQIEGGEDLFLRAQIALPERPARTGEEQQRVLALLRLDARIGAVLEQVAHDLDVAVPGCTQERRAADEIGPTHV